MGDLDVDRAAVNVGFEDGFRVASSDSAAGGQCSDPGADEKDAK